MRYAYEFEAAGNPYYVRFKSPPSQAVWARAIQAAKEVAEDPMLAGKTSEQVCAALRQRLEKKVGRDAEYDAGAGKLGVYREGKPLILLRRLKNAYEFSNKGFLKDLLEQPDWDPNDAASFFDRLVDAMGYGAGKCFPNTGVDPSRKIMEMSLADVRAFGTFVKCSRSGRYLLLHYNDRLMYAMLEGGEGMDPWDMYDGLLKECRSCVIDLYAMKYVLRPFDKFRNLGECEEYSMDAVQKRIDEAGPERVEVTEKLDGSFIQAGAIAGWTAVLLSSSGSLNQERSYQLRDAYQFIWERGNRYGAAICQMVLAHPDTTFMFEWIDKQDERIVRYDASERGLHLIGMRDTLSGQLYSYADTTRMAEQYDIPATKLFRISFDEAVESLQRMSGYEHEGYVVNIGGFLVKVKCHDYLALVGMTRKLHNLQEIVHAYQTGVLDDILPQLPAQDRKEIQAKAMLLGQYEKAVHELLDRTYATLPKDFGVKVFMVAVDALDLGKKYKAMLRCMYLGQELDILQKADEEEITNFLTKYGGSD